MAITGPVHPEIEGVPLPIVLPFGIFPLTQGRHSGLLAPTFSANEQLGLSLEGLGYYKVLNDNWDITTRATIYSYGGWNAAVSPRYYKRYHYQGNFAFNYQHFRTNFPGDPDYSLSKTFNVTWSHSSDTKARPGVTFNANVNVASSKFNSQVPNNNLRNFTNSLSSTILYSKVWKDLPFNLSLNANHTQNTIDKSFNVTLPDVSFNINTMYPFRRKEVIGSYKWYENIGIALNSSLRNHTHFTDDSLTVLKTPVGQQIIDNLQWGGNHSIPISLSLPAIGPLQISPQVGYTERWYQEKMSLSWDSSAKKIDTLNKKGFYTARDMSFGISASTRIFGMFGFGKHSRIQAIRHEIRPSISFSYKPDMNGYAYHNIQVDSIGHTTRYSIYQNSLYGAFGEGKFGGMSFSIDNNLSMKLLNKKDTGEAATKKISLIDGFSISGNYNFLLDSFRLSQLSVTARSNLFDKISISASATIDPYQTDSTGRDINRLVWKDKILTLGRLMSGNITLSSQFQGGDQKKKKKNLQNPASAYNPNTGMPLNEYETEAAYISNNPAEYADFSIPW